MRLTNKISSPVKSQGIVRARGNQRAVCIALACLTLASCGGSGKPVGAVGYVSGFGGMVAADEPRAAQIGRDVLSAGGTPADAVVAMAFSLSVTLPSQASLGAGGSCLVYDHEKKTTEALDFIAPAPTELAGTTTRPTAVPALPRGMYALHSKYGRLHWEALIQPAEAMARLGVPTSRALANQLTPFAGPLFEDGPSRAVFARPDGNKLEEGDTLTQLDLGATLSRLRTRGIGEFYNGVWAKDIANAANASGGSLTPEQLRTFLPKWYAPLSVKTGDETYYFAPPPASAGLVEAELWTALAAQGQYAATTPDARPHLLAESFARAYADRQSWLSPDGKSAQAPEELLADGHVKGLFAGSLGAHQPAGGEAPGDTVSGTGILAMNSEGSVVACSVGLNNSFGTGRMLPNLGFMLAAAPGVKGRGPYALGPMLGINHNSNEFRFAAAAGGGVSAPTSLMQVALRVVVDKKPLRDVIAEARLHAQNAPDVVQAEPGNGFAGALQSQGHEVQEAPVAGRVNALQCTSGRPSLDRCQPATDPRGNGLALILGGS